MFCAIISRTIQLGKRGEQNMDNEKIIIESTPERDDSVIVKIEIPACRLNTDEFSMEELKAQAENDFGDLANMLALFFTANMSSAVPNGLVISNKLLKDCISRTVLYMKERHMQQIDSS